jgi:hypothetical protein
LTPLSWSTGFEVTPKVLVDLEIRDALRYTPLVFVGRNLF